MEIKKFNELSLEQVKLIAETNYNHWKKFNPNLEYSKSTGNMIAMHSNVNKLPIGIAMLEKDEIVGFCTLRENRLEKYPQFNPWICNVLIFEKFREQGYGKKLMLNACEITKELGYKKVYFWTDQAPEFYKKLGFKYEQEVEKNEGGIARLFSKEL